MMMMMMMMTLKLYRPIGQFLQGCWHSSYENETDKMINVIDLNHHKTTIHLATYISHFAKTHTAL